MPPVTTGDALSESYENARKALGKFTEEDVQRAGTLLHELCMGETTYLRWCGRFRQFDPGDKLLARVELARRDAAGVPYDADHYLAREALLTHMRHDRGLYVESGQLYMEPIRFANGLTLASLVEIVRPTAGHLYVPAGLEPLQIVTITIDESGLSAQREIDDVGVREYFTTIAEDWNPTAEGLWLLHDVLKDLKPHLGDDHAIWQRGMRYLSGRTDPFEESAALGTTAQLQWDFGKKTGVKTPRKA